MICRDCDTQASRHCERSEAIQLELNTLDCFASLSKNFPIDSMIIYQKSSLLMFALRGLGCSQYQQALKPRAFRKRQTIHFKYVIYFQVRIFSSNLLLFFLLLKNRLAIFSSRAPMPFIIERFKRYAKSVKTHYI